MRRKSNKRVQGMHVSDLYKSATDGDDEALDELIDRQQAGRALRYYPEGRKSAFDEGLVPVKIESTGGSVVIRSGRPTKRVAISSETAGSWLTGIPECLIHAAKERRDNGSSRDSLVDDMDFDATEEFDFIMEPVADDQEITCKFYPEGAEAWVMSSDDVSEMLRALLECCSELGWTYDIEDEQIKAINMILGR